MLTSITLLIHQLLLYLLNQYNMLLLRNKLTTLRLHSLKTRSVVLSCCVLIVCLQSRVQGLHYAQVQHSTNPPAPPIPVEPVQYATVKKSEPVQSETSPLDVSLSTKTHCLHNLQLLAHLDLCLCRSLQCFDSCSYIIEHVHNLICMFGNVVLSCGFARHANVSVSL